jgi:hypothetical protein
VSFYGNYPINNLPENITDIGFNKILCDQDNLPITLKYIRINKKNENFINKIKIPFGTKVIIK